MIVKEWSIVWSWTSLRFQYTERVVCKPKPDEGLDSFISERAEALSGIISHETITRTRAKEAKQNIKELD